MPSSAVVLDRLTHITVAVVGCAPERVVPAARLGKDLGVDSLSVVEISEQLGRSFEVYLSDETINAMVTVQDAIDAVIDHDPRSTGPAHPATRASVARTLAGAAGVGSAPASGQGPQTAHSQRLSDDQIEQRKALARKFAWGFVVAGVAIGLIFGLGGVLFVDATGLKDVSLPATPTPSATATPTPKPTPTPTRKPTAEATPEPSLQAANSSISPGERLRLKGEFPGAGKGALLQVQVKDKGSTWDDFPVTTRTDKDGKYTTVIFTTRTGEREFRMLRKDTNDATPAIKISIG